MSYYLPNSVFLHIPKTGGSWVKRVIQNLKLDIKREDEGWHSVQLLPGKFTFAFVRHPLTWYQSIWAYCWKEKHWHYGQHVKLACCKDADFDAFIDKVASRFPKGFLNNFYAKWTKHCHFVGKYENMYNDLVTALQTAKEKFDPQIVLDMKSYTRNAAAKTDQWKNKCLYFDMHSAEKIMKIEHEIIKQYDYDYIPDGIMFEQKPK